MAFKRNFLVVVVQGALIVAALSSASPAQLTVVKADVRRQSFNDGWRFYRVQQMPRNSRNSTIRSGARSGFRTIGPSKVHSIAR